MKDELISEMSSSHALLHGGLHLAHFVLEAEHSDDAAAASESHSDEPEDVKDEDEESS